MPRRSFPFVSFLRFHLGKQFKLIRKGYFLHPDQDTGVGHEAILGMKIFLDPSAPLSNLAVHRYTKLKHERSLSPAAAMTTSAALVV